MAEAGEAVIVWLATGFALGVLASILVVLWGLRHPDFGEPERNRR